MSKDFLLEIGTEEIPSDYLENGLKEIKRLAETYLKDNRIPYNGELQTYGTPRRLILIVKDLANKQEDVTKEVTGPPKKAAYDSKGNPTKAAFGFAQKQGVSVDDLAYIETPKGEYLYIKANVPGKPTKDILSEFLPKLITEIPWPKSMRWGQIGVSFVRPIHWILVLFGDEVIPFNIADIQAGHQTRGHRFMSPKTIKIKSLKDYLQKIKAASVIIDQKERQNLVKQDVLEKAETISGKAMIDPELLVTAANLVEYPTAICGSFDSAFLSLPDPVLVTAMKKHQKYFAVQGPDNKLMPHFVAISNTKPRDESVVRKGYERVLNARLSDADFFFKEDRKRKLEDRLEDLKGVIYQAELGTSFAKVDRFTRLAQYLGETIAPDMLDNIKLAAKLCKCDLITEMVTEFPSLQGIMGREYALLDGHPEEVCQSIFEHYLPLRAGDTLPSSTIGTVVGLADRMDTIAGCFAIKLEPTGAADPFALRRHALAIIRMLEKNQWDISLKHFIHKALEIVHEQVDFNQDQVLNNILSFFKERYKQMMLRSDYQSDLIEAIISAEFDQIHNLGHRIEQLKTFASESEGFQPLAITFKRISNILKNQKALQHVDPKLLKEPCESALWDTYESIKDNVYQLMEKKQYLEALNLITTLRQPVDDFFDGVEILVKDQPKLKNNRMGILQALSELFLKLADLSKFSI